MEYLYKVAFEEDAVHTYRPVHQYVVDNSKSAVALMSALLVPTRIVNLPFSASHEHLSSSKYDRAYLSTANEMGLSSPGFIRAL